MAEKIKISAGAAKTLNNLLAKADDFAFMGSYHPDDQPDIEAAYDRAVIAVRKLINRLESNQIKRYADAINGGRK